MTLLPPFKGVIKEIPHISVDYFLGVKDVSAFFLSHCHADHMVGLAESNDIYHLLSSKSDTYIYCTSLTKTILSRWPKYSRLSCFFKVLEINQSKKIDFPGTSLPGFTVTSIQNGHCPGSVMFLFEGEGFRVLYTGDFRIAEGDFRKLKPLMENSDQPDYGLKQIDHIYLDCTFCLEAGRKLPSRDEALQDTIQLIKEWRATGNHQISFSLAGKGFGAEFFFVQLFERLQLKVHFPEEMKEIYLGIPGIAKAVARSLAEADIHACGGCAKSITKQGSSFSSSPAVSQQVRQIRLSTQWHMMDNKNNDNRTVVFDGGVHRVLYSMHSSMEEIQDFVRCFEPGKITPISRPQGATVEGLKELLKCEIEVPVPRGSSTTPRVETLIYSSRKSARNRTFGVPMTRKSSSSTPISPAVKRKKPEN